MIFKPELAELVASGKKTVTRRQVRWDEDGDPVECPYRVDRVYAVQPGRSSPAIAYIRVTSVQWQLLGDITDDDAAAEGGMTRQGFFDVWQNLTGSSDEREPVWRIEFQLT